jgi:hypothetical protein
MPHYSGIPRLFMAAFVEIELSADPVAVGHHSFGEEPIPRLEGLVNADQPRIIRKSVFPRAGAQISP